jgi:hypothetical protein
MTTTPEAPPQETARWEDYIDVFVSPVELFDRRREAGWGHPLAVLLIASVALYYLLLPANTILMREAMANADPQAAEAMERFGNMFRLIGGLFVPFGLAFAILLRSGVLWAGGKVFDVALRFRAALLITTFASFVLLVQQVLTAGLVLYYQDRGLDPIRDLSFGVVRFLDYEALPPALVPLLGAVDVFSIWQAVLTGIGVYVIARTSRGQAAALAALVWLLSSLPGVVTALVTGKVPGT